MRIDRKDGMDKQETLQKLHDLGLVAVIRGPSPELTVRMMVTGGIPYMRNFA